MSRRFEFRYTCPPELAKKIDNKLKQHDLKRADLFISFMNCWLEEMEEAERSASTTRETRRIKVFQSSADNG